MKINDFEVTPELKISGVKISLSREMPFYAYLIDHLRFVPSDKVPTIGITAKGFVYYNPKFIDSLTMGETKGVLVHEVMHLVFKHHERGTGRTAKIGGQNLINIATDMVVNNHLVMNKFQLPANGIIPNDNTFTYQNVCITDIDKKCSEEIYAEILRQIKEDPPKGDGDGQSFDGEGFPQGFDDHMFDDKDGEGKDQDGNASGLDRAGEGKASARDWDEIGGHAVAMAKAIGKLPAGMERLYENLHKGKVNWKGLLRKTVASSVPRDYTYKKCNKKYIPHDMFIPSFIGEKIKVFCAIDTSGSISSEELSDYMSEIIKISKVFNEVELRVITHDAEVHDDIRVTSSNFKKLLTTVLHGGGGTSHIPVYEYIKTKMKGQMKPQLLISFTDGYSDYPEKPYVPTVFILAGRHKNKEEMPKWGKSISIA